MPNVTLTPPDESRMTPDERQAQGPQIHALREAVTAALADRKAALIEELERQGVLIEALADEVADARRRLGQFPDDFAGLGVGHVFRQRAAEDAFAERSDHAAALHNCAHFQLVLGLAVFLDDHAVLRHVDQTAGQIA